MPFQNIAQPPRQRLLQRASLARHKFCRRLLLCVFLHRAFCPCSLVQLRSSSPLQLARTPWHHQPRLDSRQVLCLALRFLLSTTLQDTRLRVTTSGVHALPAPHSFGPMCLDRPYSSSALGGATHYTPAAIHPLTTLKPSLHTCGSPPFLII